MTCYCGHEYDEHDVGSGHPGDGPPTQECGVDGCPCVHFEEDTPEAASGSAGNPQ